MAQVVDMFGLEDSVAEFGRLAGYLFGGALGVLGRDFVADYGG